MTHTLTQPEEVEHVLGHEMDAEQQGDVQQSAGNGDAAREQRVDRHQSESASCGPLKPQ